MKHFKTSKFCKEVLTKWAISDHIYDLSVTNCAPKMNAFVKGFIFRAIDAIIYEYNRNIVNYGEECNDKNKRKTLRSTDISPEDFYDDAVRIIDDITTKRFIFSLQDNKKMQFYYKSYGGCDIINARLREHFRWISILCSNRCNTIYLSRKAHGFMLDGTKESKRQIKMMQLITDLMRRVFDHPLLRLGSEYDCLKTFIKHAIVKFKPKLSYIAPVEATLKSGKYVGSFSGYTMLQSELLRLQEHDEAKCKEITSSTFFEIAVLELLRTESCKINPLFMTEKQKDDLFDYHNSHDINASSSQKREKRIGQLLNSRFGDVHRVHWAFVDVINYVASLNMSDRFYKGLYGALNKRMTYCRVNFDFRNIYVFDYAKTHGFLAAYDICMGLSLGRSGKLMLSMYSDLDFYYNQEYGILGSLPRDVTKLIILFMRQLNDSDKVKERKPPPPLLTAFILGH